MKMNKTKRRANRIKRRTNRRTKQRNHVGGVILTKKYPDMNMEITADFVKPRKIKGDATIQFYSGETYVGPCNSNFNAHGTGTMTFPDGTKYVGQFMDGAKSGHGKIQYADGTVYEGEFFKDAPHGRGICTSAKCRYEGQLDAAHKQGLGKMTFANGDVYEGNFNNDKIDGAGILTQADGTVLEGKFRETNREIILVSEPEEAMPPMEVNPVFNPAQSAALLVQEDPFAKEHNRALRRAQIAERVAVGREELHRERKALADILSGKYDDSPDIVRERAIRSLGSLGGLVSIGSLGGLGK